MKTGFAVTFAVVGVVASVALIGLSSFEPQATSLYQVDSAFYDYVAEYRKSYGTKEEFQFRFEQFKRTLLDIQEHNSQNADYQLGLNEFSDWTPQEYKRLLGGVPEISSGENDVYAHLDYSAINGPIDWRAQGKVNAVKNQGSCGSCWAFSATSTVESKHAIRTGALLQLSEQQLVDCSHSSNNGCNGGMYDRAWKDVKSMGGQEKSADYPYTGKDGSCKFSSSKAVV